MPPDPEETLLPYSPSHSGRAARVGYLGFEGVGFNDLWPVFAGLVLSIALALKFFIADGPGAHWFLRTVLAALPFVAGFSYLRFLVVGRPPHFKGDLWSSLLGLTVDFTDPPFAALPVMPRIRLDTAAACGPGRPAETAHPMLETAARRSR